MLIRLRATSLLPLGSGMIGRPRESSDDVEREYARAAMAECQVPPRTHIISAQPHFLPAFYGPAPEKLRRHDLA